MATGACSFQAGPYETGGDVILSIDGHRSCGPTTSPASSPLHEPGDTVTLEVLRDGKREEVQVTLGKRPQG